MSWRIKQIKIEGFKFFKDPFIINFDGRHVLLYGENGSGKSSVFWSLYTLFQSCLKTQEEAQKYYMLGHPQNLRNRFCAHDDESGIAITFVDETGANTKTVAISNTKYPFKNVSAKIFMEKSMASSDFMNYKFLQKLFDFPNSKENDVFDIFEKEVFKYLQFSKPLTDLEGNVKNAMDAETWWEYIKEVPALLPRNTGKNKNTINMGSPNYKSFIRLIGDFNVEMKNALTNLRLITETIIERYFENSLRLQFEYVPVSFNNIRPNFHKSRDGKIRPPRIILTASMTGVDVVDDSPIHHPRSFFNEAKLTCAALALRMAILGTKPTSGPDYASVLLLDDVLISLDMGYRRKILNAILQFKKNRQLIVLTHDRGFFRLIEAEIEKNKEKKEWKVLEMCFDEDSIVPAPKLIESVDYLEKAKFFYHQHEYAACANTLRRAYENVLKTLFPTKYKYAFNTANNLDSPCQNLNGLISNICKFRAYYNNFPDLVPNLTNDRKLILNPFSHDDLDTPLFKCELRASIEQLELLKRITKVTLVGPDNVYVMEYKMEISNSAFSAYAEFIYLEEWDRLEYDGVSYYGNPQVRILKTSPKVISKNKIISLNNLHHLVRNAVSLNKDTAPACIDCIEYTNGAKLV